MRLDGALTAYMDNVQAWRLGEAFCAAAKMSAGDYIDRGLGLRVAMEERDLAIVDLRIGMAVNPTFLRLEHELLGRRWTEAEAEKLIHLVTCGIG